jgi:hypothetical protein
MRNQGRGIQSGREVMTGFVDDLTDENGEEYKGEMGERDCHAWDLDAKD